MAHQQNIGYAVPYYTNYKEIKYLQQVQKQQQQRWNQLDEQVPGKNYNNDIDNDKDKVKIMMQTTEREAIIPESGSTAAPPLTVIFILDGTLFVNIASVLHNSMDNHSFTHSFINSVICLHSFIHSI